MFLYQLRNWRSRLRAWWYGNTVGFESALYATVFRGDGRVQNLGLLSRRVVTTVGVRFLCDDFNAGTTDITTMQWHAWGTGTNVEAAADVGLQTPSAEARTSGSQASATVAANATYTTVGTIVSLGAQTITEHGLFSAAAAGTLWDRSVFAGIVLAATDSIQFTYVLTANSGG